MMAKYPDTHNKYPVTPKAYPTLPNAYPGSGAASFPAASAPSTPATVLGANLLQWCRADLGVTVATGVSAWADQSGNGRDYVQGTAANQPAYTASDVTLNGQASMLFDGANDQIVCAGFNLPAPGTTPTWVWMVIKPVTWTNNDRFTDGNAASSVILYQSGVTPAVVQFNTSNANSNTGLVLGAWAALAAGFTNSASDFTKVSDAAAVTGANAGNTASTGRKIGASMANASFGNFALAEIVYADAIPSAGQVADLAAYRLARYGF